MNLGSAVLTFREGLEAALIVAILLGYLRKIGRPGGRAFVWAGVGAASALTVGFVVLLQLIGASFDYPAKGVYEGVTSLLAVGMVTLCTQCAARRGITADDVLPGVRIAGAATFEDEVSADGAQALVY